MTPEATAFLAECRKQPTAIPAGDPRWPMVEELDRANLVALVWEGSRATLVMPIEKARALKMVRNADGFWQARRSRKQ